MSALSLQITVDPAHSVSALLDMPNNARACYVMAHGAGAGMANPFMQKVADGLVARGIATLRYQFPYMEAGSRRPDRPPLAHATVRAATAAVAAENAPGLPLFAGGKSFGGQMTSQAQAAAPLDQVCGLIFFGFPLHPGNKPSIERADHLDDVVVPMLFLQGTRDALADPALITQVTARLGTRALLVPVADADHSFHVPARSGRKDAEVLEDLLDSVVAWIDRALA